MHSRDSQGGMFWIYIFYFHTLLTSPFFQVIYIILDSVETIATKLFRIIF